jgi:hypothetical protein
MNYHLHHQGRDLGVFPLTELRRRRSAGELTGAELVWTAGMAAWQPLDTVLSSAQSLPGSPAHPAPAPSPAAGRGFVTAVIGAVALALIGSALIGLAAYRMLRQMRPTAASATADPFPSAMAAARQPVLWPTNAPTFRDVQNAEREFCFRQYVEGYQQRGTRNPACDFLTQQLLTNWIASDYGGPSDPHLPPLNQLAIQLANDPACQDPIALTAVAVNGEELYASIGQLERAMQGFENSHHRGFPKFFTTVTLAKDAYQIGSDRQAVLDPQALDDLRAAFADGSFKPSDQAELADILLNGWGKSFYSRHSPAICSLIEEQGDAYRWLALVLRGENEITEAWRARGSGYADTVSSQGLEGFNRHLALARTSLTRAWQLDPRQPLAPCRMMTVALGDSGISEMRVWFDRTVAAQPDYVPAWREMLWGLRPRWYGDLDSMLAFGQMALQTRHFDTCVPKIFFDTVGDLESEADLPPGQHLYAREDLWPQLQKMYAGYVDEPSLSPSDREDWRTTFAVVARLTGKYDIARTQLQALHWQPRPACLAGWDHDLSLLAPEVAARTGPQSDRVSAAEACRDAGDAAGALKIYQELSTAPHPDAVPWSFIQDRLATLTLEQRSAAGQWVDFLPADTNFTGWAVGFGKFKLLPDGALEVTSDEHGHLLYSRARLGTEFEVRGEFAVVSSTTTSFQGGLVMGLPDWNEANWYAFRIKRNSHEGEVVNFSQHWYHSKISPPVSLDSHLNAFDFSFHKGLVSATVNGHEVLRKVSPPEDSDVSTNEFYLGLGAFNDSNTTVIRYQHLQVRRL